MKDENIFRLIVLFIVFMHFEGFLKLFFNYHPLIHGLKYVFATVFFIIWLVDIEKFKTPIHYPMILFCIFVFIQLLNPLMWSPGGIIISILGLFYQIGYLPLFFIGYKILNKNRLTKLMLLIILLATLSAITAHVQYKIGVPNYINLMPYTATPFVIGHANVYGPIAFDLIPPNWWYMAGLIFCLYFYFSGEHRLLFSVLGLNLLAAILMSGLRMSMLLSGVAVCMFLLFRIKQALSSKDIKKIAFALIFAAVILAFLVTNILTESQKERYILLANPIAAYIDQRGFTYLQIKDTILKYPFGAGLRHGGIETNVEADSTEFVNAGDNYFNGVLGELGILGFISLIVLFYFILKKGLANYFSVRDKKSKLTIAAFTSIIFVFMIGSIYGSPNGWMFWMFSAIVLNTTYLNRNGTDEENKVMDGSVLMSNIKKLFRGSIFNRIIQSGKNKEPLSFLKNSKTISFFEKVFDFIKNSMVYKLVKMIID